MKVKEAMHKGAVWVYPDTSIRDVARMMREEDIGAIPVGADDRLIGMVTDRDIACRAVADGRDPNTLCARDVMTEAILYCKAEEEVEDAIRIMEAGEVRRLPVVNDKKRLVGILALGDICAGASHEISGAAIKAVAAHHA